VDGGSKEIMKLLLSLASNSFTSIEYWERQPFSLLKKWTELMNEEGAKDDG